MTKFYDTMSVMSALKEVVNHAAWRNSVLEEVLDQQSGLRNLAHKLHHYAFQDFIAARKVPLTSASLERIQTKFDELVETKIEIKRGLPKLVLAKLRVGTIVPISRVRTYDNGESVVSALVAEDQRTEDAVVENKRAFGREGTFYKTPMENVWITVEHADLDRPPVTSVVAFFPKES